MYSCVIIGRASRRRPSRPQHARCPTTWPQLNLRGTGNHACGVPLRRDAVWLAFLSERPSRPASPISNRHTPRLENAVTHTKHSPDLISNRHKFAFRGTGNPACGVRNADAVSLFSTSLTSVFVNSVRPTSVPSVLSAFDFGSVAPPQKCVRIPRKLAHLIPAEIPSQILEFNVNHSKQTPIQFLIATLFCD